MEALTNGTINGNIEDDQRLPSIRRLWSMFMIIKQNELLINRHKQRAALFRRRSQQLTQILMTLPLTAKPLHRRRRKRSVHMQQEAYWEREVPHNNENQYKEDFRMSTLTFRWLVKQIKQINDNQQTNLNNALGLSLEKSMAIVLYALGTNVEYSIIAKKFGIDILKLRKILPIICNEICNTFEETFLNAYPPTPSKIEENLRGFEILGFPQTYGAIAVSQYTVHSSLRLALLAVVDYRLRFMQLNIETTRDSMNSDDLLATSDLSECHESNPLFSNNSSEIMGTNVPVLLIGNKTFTLRNYLMTPYSGTPTLPKEIAFNKAITHASCVADSAFQHLKARFLRLWQGALKCDVANAALIIKTCCILHNILNERNEEIKEAWLQLAKTVEKHANAIDLETRDYNDDASAVDIRNAIAEFCNNDA